MSLFLSRERRAVINYFLLVFHSSPLHPVVETFKHYSTTVPSTTTTHGKDEATPRHGSRSHTTSHRHHFWNDSSPSVIPHSKTSSPGETSVTTPYSVRIRHRVNR